MDYQEMETEQDFVSDLAACFRARALGMQHGWPNYNILGKTLNGALVRPDWRQ